MKMVSIKGNSVDPDEMPQFLFSQLTVETLMKKELSLAGLLHLKCNFLAYYVEGLHWLEKYLNMKGFHEKSLKIKSALKSADESLLALLKEA